MSFQTHFTARVSATTMRLVRCEKCDAQYVYPLRRKAKAQFAADGWVGSDDPAAGTARNLATEHLAKSLRKGCEPVPCPKCRWYQSHMRERAADLTTRWMHNLAVWLIIGGGVAVFPLMFILAAILGKGPDIPAISAAITGVFVFLGVCLLIARAIAQAGFDPNQNPERLRAITLPVPPKGVPLEVFRDDVEVENAKLYEAYKHDSREVREHLTLEKQLILPLWLTEDECRPFHSLSVALPDGSTAQVSFPARCTHRMILNPLVDGTPHPTLLLELQLLTEAGTSKEVLVPAPDAPKPPDAADESTTDKLNWP